MPYPLAAVRPHRTRKPAGGPAADPVLYFVPIIGQSNATGTAPAGPPLSTAGPPAPQALMFNGGLRPGGAAPQRASLVPLVESAIFFSTSTTGGETIAWGMADRLITLTGGLKTFVFAIAAITGTAYAAMAKGTATYQQVLDWTTALVSSLAASIGKTSVKVLCVPCLHGEQDQQNANVNYPANITTWQSDYETDLKAITGQTGTIPLIACQQAHYPPGQGAVNISTANNVWIAHKANPTKIKPLGSRQQYAAQQTDGSTIHISNYSERWHGGLYGNAAYRTTFGGEDWRPLAAKPGLVNFSSGLGAGPTNAIIAKFSVPTPPIVLDFSTVSKNLTAGQMFGFSYFDDNAPPTITSVTVTNVDELTFGLSGVPTGSPASRVIRSGWGSGSGNQGPWRGNARCNLRDSEPSLGVNGVPLWNFCTKFQEAVT